MSTSKQSSTFLSSSRPLLFSIREGHALHRPKTLRTRWEPYETRSTDTQIFLEEMQHEVLVLVVLIASMLSASSFIRTLSKVYFLKSYKLLFTIKIIYSPRDES